MLNDKWRQVYQLLQFSAFIFTITRSHCVISRPSAQSDSATFLGGGFLRKATAGTAETRARILTQNTSNDVVLRKEVPFGGRETKM